MFNYQDIIDAIIDGDTEKTITLTKQALAKGYPGDYILEKGLIAGMNKVADKFRYKKVLVPEVFISARAMNAGLSIVEPFFKKNQKKSNVKAILGTVAGDFHDIGKYLVKMMVMITGTRLIDLGVDVTVSDFMDSVRKEKPDILMMSALLTTTMPVMKEVIEELDSKKLRNKIKVIIGGAPVTEDFAKKIGADYYFPDAFELKYFLDNNLGKLVSK